MRTFVAAKEHPDGVSITFDTEQPHLGATILALGLVRGISLDDLVHVNTIAFIFWRSIFISKHIIYSTNFHLLLK